MFIFFIVGCILFYGIYKKIFMYEKFVEGGKDGL